MSRHELYSPEGLRIDGRRWNELRRFYCEVNTRPNSSDGSSLVEQGNTKVVCGIKGPQEPELKSHASPDGAHIKVSLKIAPFSTFDRRQRSRSDRGVQEMEMIIERTFREAILVHLHPRTEIIISINVLSQDGGLFAACINATTLALIDAGIPMYDYVCSCSAAIYENSPLLDPNHPEETELSFLTVAVLGRSERISSLLLENKMSMERLESVLSLSIAGCHSIREIMDKRIRKHAESRLAKLNQD